MPSGEDFFRFEKMNKAELEKIWSQVPVDYYEKGIVRNLGQRYWHKQKFLVIKKLLADFFPGKILDIGSNGGGLTAKIANLFPKAKTVGIDVYEKSVFHASSLHPNITFLVADGRNLPFKNNHFDLILCLETLEHVVDPNKTLLEIKRCLTKNGRAVISMDSGNLLFRIIWFFWIRFGKGRVWRGSHLTHFNKKILKEIILKNGFLIEREIVSHFGMAVTLQLKKK